MTTPFTDFGLDAKLLAGVPYEAASPIQCAAIPPLLEGRDVVGRARTGSGKTAAFGLPLLHRVREGGKHPRALILTPTRELALQVAGALEKYAQKLRLPVLAVYGGSSYGPQLQALRRGAPVIVGTPGRVIDHIERGTLDLSKLETLVLDEADEMLTMGFMEEVTRVLEATPDDRQIALFSASWPRQIERIAKRFLNNPVELQVEEKALSTDHIVQRWILTPQSRKLQALVRVLRAEPPQTTLIFARTKAGCAAVADELANMGMSCDALHGDLNQAARERVLQRLRSKRLRVLVATDVASRGIDVEHIELVINLDLPRDPEKYVHRIGRTGRAGRKGKALSFVTGRERRLLHNIMRELRVDIPQMDAPTEDDIRRRRLAELSEAILETEIDSDATDFLAKLAEESGQLPTEIAERLISALSADRRVELSRPKPRPERQERQERRDEPVYDNSAEIELFLAVGRRHGIRPGDLVGALANECGIPGSLIGRITISEMKSFVRMPRDPAEYVLANHPTLQLRGRETRVARSKGHQTDNRDRRPGR
ncbi:MAG: DEAD/DEAH box helicase [Proteobacteria bacterium]|nr:DEAD/DEAH box helicase [Pseudomonadota bacterium]MCP4920914.1 DEAD/DEAH box helicase [Pseudomonadota bacterium]